ncbi:protoporphyrinogen oxidase [Mycolicibacterium chubuense NBB4]|uniref:Protoporphyrinogen oxidase n=1 Tax=Mycolicibacterium chubuense (strain NBB4) TaxID=710421 RepID=I4BFR4_MYCCN|nr:NAD(P)/FAD-dependent oxidoreductase [Mycolicibacterium chubuense]AFM16121.1 protoporphyrinogen oxidase [Mycolicibacterium chubuense NBB4]
MQSSRNPLIIGAGPAGLTAGLELVKRGVTPRIYEASAHVGGLARTPADGDWRIDPGGHRFFTRSEDVADLWRSLLPADQWIAVPRRSAMLVRGHYVQYPLVGRHLLTQMGLHRGARGAGSLMWHRFRRGMGSDHSGSFRDWGRREFGRYWYDLFFDGYVRKTWLTDPEEITSDWANQRIKPIGWRLSRGVDPMDQDVFRYPRHGPGQLWEAAAATLRDHGVGIALNSPIVHARYDGTTWMLEKQNGTTASGDALFSSMPLRSLVDALEPEPPKHIKTIAARLRHRSLITVAVALSKRYDIPYNWVYTPEPHLRVGRIQNYGRWSRDLSPRDWNGTFVGLEYFLLPDSDLWVAGDDGLGAVVEQDLAALGLDASTIERVIVVRSQHAYPIYNSARDRSVVRVRDYLREHYPSLHPMGRNGMHHYDNQDHAMLSAMRSVGRYFGENVDPWQVNSDLGYHEHGVLKR